MVDDIAKDMMACADNPVLFKIYIAFSQFAHGPSHHLKFDIHWQSQRL